jgi:DNA-binding transcriptional LysR family regulator
MWSGPELRDLDVFLTLAEELHFGRTAEKLRMTPSRVSQIIRGLEHRVGGALFERTSRRVRLTPLGERFAQNLAPAYEQIHRAYTDAREVANGVAGTLRFGMYSPVNGGPHLLEIVAAFQARYPACAVRLVETDLARDQLGWLRQCDVDCLAMRLPLHDPDLIVGPVLSRERRILLVAKDHPLAGRRSIRYEDVADYVVPAALPTLPTEMMDEFMPPVTPSGKRLRRAEVHSVSEALMRVVTGEVVHPTVASFLEHHRNPGVTAVPIRDLPPSETALVWLRSNETVKVRALVQTAHDVLGSRERVSKRASHHPRSMAS